VVVSSGSVGPVPDPGRFNIIRPDKQAAPPAAPPPAAQKKPADKKAPDVNLGVEPGNFPLARAAAANPQVEADRQVEAGHDAFLKGEFGLAIEHFRHATARLPDEAVNWFLLAQVQFAIGKYDDAVASINAGMKRDPEWPQSRFQSREIYGNNHAAFDVHLQNLRNSLAADPNDPCLLFLLGVELWFDGKRDEARALLERAAQLAKDPAPAQAFLKK
jgi:tetratricopeptide (TPR) repeat protein